MLVILGVQPTTPSGKARAVVETGQEIWRAVVMVASVRMERGERSCMVDSAFVFVVVVVIGVENDAELDWRRKSDKR